MRHALAFALTLCAATAAAQPSAVEAEHQRGVQLRAQGQNAEAAEVFRAIFERTGEPRALARLGLAEGALSRWADADEHLTTALARAGDPWITANRASLEQALAAVRTHLGAVTIVCETPGATVQVGDAPPQPLPLSRPLRVTTGFVAVVVRAPGHRALERRVAVPAGEAPIRVDATLTPEAAAPVVPPPVVPPPVVPPPVVPPPVVPPPVVPPSPTRARASWHRPVGIGLFAGAGVALGLGVVGTLLREGAVARFNDAGCLLHPDRDELTTNNAACRDHLASTRMGAGVSVGSFVAAGVLAAAGVTVFLLSPRARDAVQVSAALAPNGAHGAVTVRF
ncbi:MAG: hypothetical protein U0325_29590 [Polyangiales bacterium]